MVSEDEPAQTETIDFIQEVFYPEQEERYKLILTKTKRFYVIDLTPVFTPAPITP